MKVKLIQFIMVECLFMAMIWLAQWIYDIVKLGKFDINMLFLILVMTFCSIISITLDRKYNIF